MLTSPARSSISISINIGKVIMIYQVFLYKMQTDMSRGSLAEGNHGRKGMRAAAEGRPPSIFKPFLPWSSSPSHLAFLFALYTEIHGTS